MHPLRSIENWPAAGNVGLAAFRNAHQGEEVVVCGCGPSLRDLTAPQDRVTIGVNDVGRLFDPTYLVVVNPRTQFKNDRFRYVETSNARALFTQLDLGAVRPPVVRFRLGKYGGTDVGAGDTLHYTQNSPYVAVCLAAYMGARRIGLIGVDLTDHHFFGATGRHPLASRVREIDEQYRRLAGALAARGVELVNLSAGSRLTSLPKTLPASLTTPSPLPADDAAGPSTAPIRRVFFVHYQFLSCGDVFTRGLENAARDLGLEWAGASCDDAGLVEAVHRFRPELLFVVHGRRFRQRWNERFRSFRRAVWLLDEPYEVDETIATSRLFDTVFVNDPSTIGSHPNAHYLPCAWDPHVHVPAPEEERRYDVGFIGGGNPTREAFLRRLAREGLLSYLVGGPWQSVELRRLSLGSNVPPPRTTELYRQTRLVVNVFRDRHHFNKKKIPATSLNPRVYEALACGALVVSEDRPELREVFPELPSFRDGGGLVATVRGLLSDDNARRRLLADCRERLVSHTYAERLRTALAIAARGAGAAPSHGGTVVTDTIQVSTRTPETAILMVVHGAMEMTRLAVLRTLRHSADSDARLVVVDNASNDGTREWLRILARRGDIDLVESPVNAGHGAGLELARARTRAPYLVTLDSDAFPLADDWLTRLRARLDDGAAAAGILHHRGYIHPSCLMIARGTLDELGLTFLADNRPRGLDVAERISVELRKRGRPLAGLQRTASRRRGSISEPVYLGAEYEGIVHHQWYTTRAAIVPGRPVDDVPLEALERSLAETLEEGHREPRDATMVVGLRTDGPNGARLRNARGVLAALNFQDLARYRYRIVLVEQDREPRAPSELAMLADRSIFVYNPGAYNRGWAFNVGASLAGPGEGAVCFMDADLLVPPDFIRRGLEALARGTRAVLPYRRVRYLDAKDSDPAIAERLRMPASSPDPDRFRGRVLDQAQGGALWVDAGLYREIGGHDERFRGWGAEDCEIYQRLTHVGAAPSRLDGTLIHLDHPRVPESDPLVRANRALLSRLSESRPVRAAGTFGDPRRYADEKPREAVAAAGHRDWEHWHRWDDRSIARIVADEKARPEATSPRRAIADIAARLGSRILDAGCGPGATWPHLARHQPRVTWVGADVTAGMLSAARQWFPHVPVVRADAGHLPWSAGAFDVVVLRHVLEHVPEWLMKQTLAEAVRVASRAVVIGFYVPPAPAGTRQVTRVAEGFLETRWTAADLEAPIRALDWTIRERHVAASRGQDEVWVLVPARAAGIPSVAGGAGMASAGRSLKFSIIMPTYRRGHCLNATIATILAQTYSNWELIVIDNAGDSQVAIADPRISTHVHTERSSAAYARNKGLSYATGDFVCFFDDDDDMYPRYLERLAAAFRGPRVKMVRCGMTDAHGHVNYSYATPEVCLRREYAEPTWEPDGPCQDQLYYRRIISRHRWTEQRGDIVALREPLCRANRSPVGGLRAGAL